MEQLQVIQLMLLKLFMLLKQLLLINQDILMLAFLLSLLLFPNPVCFTLYTHNKGRRFSGLYSFAGPRCTASPFSVGNSEKSVVLVMVVCITLGITAQCEGNIFFWVENVLWVKARLELLH